MIKNIIFDFGDVFINLDKQATNKELSKISKDSYSKKLEEVNILYETGKISTREFIQNYENTFPGTPQEKLIDTWNAILLDFPAHRLNFIEDLASRQNYNLVLLSNTNELHIDWIKNNISFYNRFKSCFDAFYLSHEIHMRKPNTDIFRFVLEQHQFIPGETIFIDDTKENTDAAHALGIHIWNNNPKTEDITNLFTIKSSLF